MIYSLYIQNIDCSAGVLQEFMHMLPRFIGDNGLSEFVLDGLKENMKIDMRAMRDIL